MMGKADEYLQHRPWYHFSWQCGFVHGFDHRHLLFVSLTFLKNKILLSKCWMPFHSFGGSLFIFDFIAGKYNCLAWNQHTRDQDVFSYFANGHFKRPCYATSRAYKHSGYEFDSPNTVC